MNTLVSKSFGSTTIRIVTIDNQPWFVAKDVCDALQIVNSARAVAPLAADERNVHRLKVGGRANTVISESGVYKLTMRSDKPQARAFQDWVTRDVLPAIRKDGAYVMGEEKVATGELSIEEMTLKVIDAMQKKIARLTEENAAMSAELNLVTVDEYRALRHAYWPRGFNSVLGKEAVLVALMHGVKLTQQDRSIRRYGKTIDVRVNVYPREILDEAFGRVEWRLRAFA